LADCLTDIDAVISTYTIRHETCSLARGGLYCIMEIWLDPDSQIGYPSIPRNVHKQGH